MSRHDLGLRHRGTCQALNYRLTRVKEVRANKACKTVIPGLCHRHIWMFFGFHLFVWIHNHGDDTDRAFRGHFARNNLLRQTFPSCLFTRACWLRQHSRFLFTSNRVSRWSRNIMLFDRFTRATPSDCVYYWLIIFSFKRASDNL